MTPAFAYLRQYVHRTVGIVLDADKQYLIESRLNPLARLRGLETVEALIEEFRSTRNVALGREIIEAMTTNETYFFRDRGPFQLFHEVILPQLLAARQAERHLRIWCAASSTGQEPYSLAMILDEEARQLKGWRIEIVATDVSEAALQAARQGVYNQFEVQRGLPVSHLLRYFNREGDFWRLAEHLRSRVHFRQLNLLDDFRDLGQFDVVFCRNVLIYFDPRTKTDILVRLRKATRPDGYLVMGAAETVVGVSTDWTPHAQHPSLIVPAGQAADGSMMGRPVLKLVSSL